METKLIQPRVWIASYTASEHAGTLSRGLFFRSIHDSKEDAETFRRDPYAKDLTITEYVLAAAPPEDTIASLPKISEEDFAKAKADEMSRGGENGININARARHYCYERHLKQAQATIASKDKELAALYDASLDIVCGLHDQLDTAEGENQELRQVVKEYREMAYCGTGKTRCSTCVKADAILAPKPVAPDQPAKEAK